MTDRPPSPFSSWRRWRATDFLIFPIGAVVGLSVGRLAGEQRGWVAAFLTGALLVLVRVSWPLRATSWFWVAVAGFALGDTLAVGLIDWSFTDKWTGHTFGGLATLDVGAMMAIVYGLYRLNYGRPGEVIEENPADLPDYAQSDLDL